MTTGKGAGTKVTLYPAHGMSYRLCLADAPDDDRPLVPTPLGLDGYTDPRQPVDAVLFVSTSLGTIARIRSGVWRKFRGGTTVRERRQSLVSSASRINRTSWRQAVASLLSTQPCISSDPSSVTRCRAR